MAMLVSLSIFFPGIYFLRPSVLVLARFILLKHNSFFKDARSQEKFQSGYVR